MSPTSTKFKKLISLLFILNLSLWIVAGSELENPDWKMWIGTDETQLNNKRITAKSVFVAPLLSKCSEGYKLDHLGRCVKIASINHENQWKFLLDKLNSMFANNKPEPSSDIVGSEPYKLNIPISNNIISEDKTPKPSVTIGATLNTNTSPKIEQTTRKQPHFTNLFDMQTTLSDKIESTAATKLEVTTDIWGSTKPVQESTNLLQTLQESTGASTTVDDKETTLWNIFPPKNRTQATILPTEITTHNAISTVDFSSEPTFSGEKTTLFTAKPPLFEKLGTMDTMNTETTNQSTESTLSVSDVKTTFESTNTDTESTSELSKRSTTSSPITKSTISSSTSTSKASPLTSSASPSPTSASTTTSPIPTSTTTESPFLIIVTDTNNHIVNSEKEEQGEKDYILISNSSSNVNKPSEGTLGVKNSEVKIVDKLCIDSELCPDDTVVLPYFESTKTTRNDQTNPNNTKESLKSPINSTSESTSVSPPLENTEIVNLKKPNASNVDYIYESLKMSSTQQPPSSLPPLQTSTSQSLLHIVHPTPVQYSSTSVYNPSKKSTSQRLTPTQRPLLTTTQRIYTHPSTTTEKPYDVYNLMYSIEPDNSDYSVNSDQQYGSGSTYQEPSYAVYDTSSYVRFPNEQPPVPPVNLKKYPNSKFSLEFQNTFAAGSPAVTSDIHHEASNNFVRFPTLSRTPASTYNAQNRWSNTRWPPQPQPQAASSQYDSWNSRWPVQQQSQQPYYNQNSRFQQNIPLTNYKLLQL